MCLPSAMSGRRLPDPARIRSAIDVERLRDCSVTIVGCGGSFGLVLSLARCGVRNFKLVDPDTVNPTNLARQGFTGEDCDEPKVCALARHIRAIRCDAEVEQVREDFTTYEDEELDARFGSTDHFVFATDSFPAQAYGNRVALRLRKPALWIGLYAGAGAGEIVSWRPGLPCFRCLCGRRYEAQSSARHDPPSDDADIFSVTLLDSIAGMLALGHLTQGANNRFGLLLANLGDRNYIQVMLHSDYRFSGRDLFREQLEVPADNDRFFSWVTVARRDPQAGLPPCPDCLDYGHRAGEGYTKT